MEEFIKKLADALDLEDPSALKATTKFRDLYEWSSLAVLSLVAMYDDEYGKEINAKNLKECTTVADLYELAVK